MTRANFVVLSTWNHGVPANNKAMKVLQTDGTALDAAELGVCETESDPTQHTVGLSGYPDANGIVTLDASIMDHLGRAGSVAYVRGVEHPISLARMVMEKTPHVMLVGDGAEDFARSNGIPILPNKLHPDMEIAYENWKETKKYETKINRENETIKAATAGTIEKPSQGASERDHDTIGMVVLDPQQRLAASCTTSGLSFKLPGRVGDSPIIGSGLYVDGDIGAAVATGVGEVAMRAVVSFLVVEKMRMGLSPQTACEEGVNRMIEILSKTSDPKKFQVGILAVSKNGEVGAYSILPGFSYVHNDKLLQAGFALNKN